MCFSQNQTRLLHLIRAILIWRYSIRVKGFSIFLSSLPDRKDYLCGSLRFYEASGFGFVLHMPHRLTSRKSCVEDWNHPTLTLCTTAKILQSISQQSILQNNAHVQCHKKVKSNTSGSHYRSLFAKSTADDTLAFSRLSWFLCLRLPSTSPGQPTTTL